MVSWVADDKAGETEEEEEEEEGAEEANCGLESVELEFIASQTG